MLFVANGCTLNEFMDQGPRLGRELVVIAIGPPKFAL